MNTERARDVLASEDSYRVVSERIAMFQAQMKYTLEALWAEVVAEALSTFNVAVALARDPKEAELAQHIAVIRGHLGRRNGATGKRKKEPKPE